MACEPKSQYNDFNGNGVEVNYTFTFPYINTEDVKVRTGEYPDYIELAQTEYSVDEANPTVVTFNVAPSGPFRIYRCTYDQALEATFQAGSAIRAADLNDNFEQMLYIIQDANIRSVDAQEVADLAYQKAEEAIATANEAKQLAEEAKEIAEEALEKADQALDLVADQAIGKTVPNVAALPANPADVEFYTVIDSTGVENMVPQPNFLPDGFVGSDQVSVKLYWNGSSYDFLQAYARNPDERYLQPGDNVSELNNDAGYITLSDVPTPAPPTLQSVTDAGNTTTNGVTAGSFTTSGSVSGGTGTFTGKITADGYRIDLLDTLP